MAKKKADIIAEAKALGIETKGLTVKELLGAMNSPVEEATPTVKPTPRRVRECDQGSKLKANKRVVL